MKNRYWHPFLLTAFPALSLFVHNLLPAQRLPVLLLPLLLGLLLAGVVFFLLKKLLSNPYKAAIITTLISVFFFSYGHLYEFFVASSGSFAALSPHVKHILPLAAGFLATAALVFLVIRTRKDLSPVNGFLNVVSLIAIAQPVFSFAMEEYKAHRVAQKYEAGIGQNATAGAQKTYPDIYYIMMDGYGRADLLQQDYGYDNSPFLNNLKSKGFYVANCSQSNYTHTVFSQAATTNMQYVDDIAVVKNEREEKSASQAIFNNEVFRFLKKLGYRTVSFDAAVFDHVQVTGTDVYYRTPTLSGFAFDNFHYQLISLTPVQLLLKFLENDQSRYNELHREKILHGFRKLKEAHTLRGPVMVYAHFLAPHNPHVFGKNGEPLDPQIRVLDNVPISDTTTRNTYRQTYRDELHYLNTLLTEAIDSIIANSATPPVIVLQSDHGPDAKMDVNSLENSDPKERFANLFAIYLPNQDTSQLYQTITPVNTFRVVFNNTFNASLPLLPDKSYYSTHKEKMKFTEMGNLGCGAAK